MGGDLTNLHGDFEEFERGARDILARAENALRRATEFEQQQRSGNAPRGRQFEEAVERERATERVRAQALGETELVTQRAAAAARQEAQALERDTAATERNAAAKRRLSEAQQRMLHGIATEGIGGTDLYQNLRGPQRRTFDSLIDRQLIETMDAGRRVRATDVGYRALGQEPPRPRAQQGDIAGEARAAQVVEAKAQAATRAAEAIERQNVALRDAGAAAEGEERAARAVLAKALAAERAAAALAQQNELMRAAGAMPAAGATAVGQNLNTTPTAGQVATQQRAVAARRIAADQRAQAAAADRLAESEQIVARAESQLGEVQRRSRLGYSAVAAQISALDDGMRRHGALTTEAIEAAARGTMTYRELGYQVGATAAKFAGWTAVSIPIFAALEGVRRLGTGAVESVSGVNELQRYLNDLDTDRAQSQFRDLSREFNLPIGDVTEAMGGMARVFNDQERAMVGAQAVLTAVRVGDLEVADATRFLGATVQGFRMDASELPTVLDQINQAQNRLNLQVRDGSAGIARAAGSWRAAGGTFSDLLAIMVTAQRSTGATGEVVGTALRRSAEFIGREANQARLREFGIDPTTGIDDVYRQAFELVQSRQVQGQEITRLATALASPQLAAVIGPTLQNADLYRRALRETSAEASRGSAQRELDIQLRSLREQIREVGNELEQLGSALAQSGFLVAFGAALDLMQLTLGTATDLLGVFNEIPSPLREALAIWLQLYGVMRLARRFDVGSRFAEGTAANRLLTRDPDRRNELQIGRDLGDRERIAAEEARRTSLAAGRARSREIAARRRMEFELGRTDVDETYDEGVERRRRFTEAWQRTADRADDLALETTYMTDEMRQARQDVRDFRNVPRSQAVQFAIDRDVYGTRTFERPTADAPTGFGPGPHPPGIGEQMPLWTAGQQSLFDAGDAHEDQARAAQQSAQRGREQLRRVGNVTTTLAEEMRREGMVIGAFNYAGLRVYDAAGNLIGRTGDAREGLRRTGTRLADLGREFAGMIGPFDLVLAGLIIIPQIVQHMNENAEQEARELEEAMAQAHSRAGEAAQLQHLRTAAGRGMNFDERVRTFGDRLVDKETAGLAMIPGLGIPLAGTRALLGAAGVGDDKGDERKREIEEAIDRIQRAAANRQFAARSGRLIPEAYIEDVKDAMNNDFRYFREGQIDLAGLREYVNNLYESIRASSVLTDQQKREQTSTLAQRMIDETPNDAMTLYRDLQKISDEDLGKRIDAWQSIVDSGEATDGILDSFVRDSIEMFSRLAGKRDPQSIAARAELSRGLAESFAEGERSSFEDAMGVATTEAQRESAERAYRRGMSPDAIRRLGRQRAQGYAEAIRRNSGAYAQEQAEMNRQQEAADNIEDPAARWVYTHMPSGAYQQARAALRRRRATLRRLFRQLGANDRVTEQMIEDTRDERLEIERNIFERNDQRQALEDRVELAGIKPGPRRTERAIELMGSRMNAAIAQFGKEDDRSLELIEAYRNLQWQAAEERERNQAEHIRSIFAVRIARLEDPNAIARQKLAEEQAVLRTMTPGTDEYRVQLAQVIGARRGVRDTAVSEELEDLRHRERTGRITEDAYIAGLRRIKNTMRMSRDARRQIEEEIYRLTHDNSGDLDVDLGNIRLPTPYEVRSLVAQRVTPGDARARIQTNNSFHIEVHRDADVGLVYDALAEATGASLRSVARAGGDL